IVNADFFPCAQIVIHDHSSCADDGHFTNFAGFEPAALDGCKTFARKGERHVCHILDPGSDVSVALAINSGGKFVENMENDRDIVWRQIPGDIDVLLE